MSLISPIVNKQQHNQNVNLGLNSPEIVELAKALKSIQSAQSTEDAAEKITALENKMIGY